MREKKQNIWIIDNNKGRAAEVELKLKKDNRIVTKFENDHQAFKELHELLNSSNGDNKPDLIVASSHPESTPKLESFFEAAEFAQTPVIVYDYAKEQAAIQQIINHEKKPFKVSEYQLSDLPSLANKVIAESKKNNILSR